MYIDCFHAINLDCLHDKLGPGGAEALLVESTTPRGPRFTEGVVARLSTMVL